MQFQAHPFHDNAYPPYGFFRLRFSAAHHHKVSSPGESHPQALSEQDVNLSAHTAPIIQPPVESPTIANDGIISHLFWQRHRANGLHIFDASISCAFVLPISLMPD
jgi:hypothetical protein